MNKQSNNMGILSHQASLQQKKIGGEDISKVGKTSAIISFYVAGVLSGLAPNQAISGIQVEKGGNVVQERKEVGEKFGITQENITEERLHLFLSQVNRTLASLDKEDSLHVTSLIMKQVKIKNGYAWQLSLVHGNKRSGFILIPGENSPSYALVSSQVATIKWATKKMHQWGEW